MKPRDVTTSEEAQAIVDARGLAMVKVAIPDINGALRGKYWSRDKFLSALRGEGMFCEALLGFVGPQGTTPDRPVRILAETCRAVPMEGDMLLFLGEFATPEAMCPRSLLRHVLGRAEAMGYEALAAAEYEFLLLEETPQSLKDKEHRDLRTVTPTAVAYSGTAPSVVAEFYRDLAALAVEMDFPIESLHPEAGSGLHEAALAHAGALEAADRAALFKTFVKVLAETRGWMATFMAMTKQAGAQSGHLHISLTRGGEPVFHDTNKTGTMSDEMRWFIGGQQRLLPEVFAMIAPTVNSYKRVATGFQQPKDASWGVENRTVALRAITGTPNGQRIEYRMPGADMNPYLALAAAVGSGLWGIEHRVEPEAPASGNNAIRRRPSTLTFPRTLGAAAATLSASEAARQIFGEAFVEHYQSTRVWEERRFHEAVTDWEMARYLEII